MRRTLLLLLLFPLELFSQQLPQFSYPQGALEAFNPAEYGTQQARVVSAYRDQWVDFEGSPLTLYNGLSLRIDKDDSNEISHGVALTHMYDKIGFTDSHFLKAGYAFRYKMDRSTLGIGANLGLWRLAIDYTGAIFIDPNDPSIPSTKASEGKLVIDTGVLLRNNDERWHVGLGISSLSAPYFKTLNYDAIPHYWLHGGYSLNFNSKLKTNFFGIAQSTMVTTQIMVNHTLTIHDLLTIGYGYRYQDAFLGIVGIDIHGFGIRYIYDHTVSALQRYSNGSHEIQFSWNINRES